MLSYLQHPAVTVVVQIAVGMLTGNWWAGGAVIAGYFIGREIAQAEYRWIEQYGLGRRTNKPWWGAFDLRVWTKLDQWLDWLSPIVVTFAVMFIARALGT